MKKTLSLLLLILMIVSSITGCSVNNAVVQNQYSIRSDPSNIIYYFGNCLNIDKEDLTWCRYYEIIDRDIWILVQYKEKNDNTFKYFLSLADWHLDGFYNTEYDFPLAFEASAIEEQTEKYYTRTKLYIDIPSYGGLNFILYSNKQGLIEAIISNKNANDISASMNDCMAYKFVYNDKKYIEQVYEIDYSYYYYDYETWSLDEALPELSGGGAENYIYNEDGSLNEQYNSSYRYLYSYDHNLRSTVEVYYNYNGMDKISQKIEYTRNNNGVTSNVLSIRYNVEDQTIQSEWNFYFTYNGSHLTVDEH